jgi:methyl-accepting chemotaxis protein
MGAEKYVLPGLRANRAPSAVASPRAKVSAPPADDPQSTCGNRVPLAARVLDGTPPLAAGRRWQIVNIRTKLFVGISTILILLAAQATVVYVFLERNHELASGSVVRSFEQSVQVAQIAIEGQKLRRFEKEYFIYVANDEKRAKYDREWHESYDKLGQMLRQLERSQTYSPPSRDKLPVLVWRQAYLRYGDEFEKVIRSVNSGRITTTSDANFAIQAGKNAFRELLDGATKGGDVKYGEALITVNDLAANSSLMRSVVLGVCAANMVIALVLLIVVPRSITRPIASLSEAAHKMSTGHLGEAVPTPRISEFAELGRTLERLRVSQKIMIERLSSARSHGSQAPA